MLVGIGFVFIVERLLSENLLYRFKGGSVNYFGNFCDNIGWIIEKALYLIYFLFKWIKK